MENAAKALLIAAGMFFIILIVSAIVVFRGEISSYFTQKHEATVIEQTKKFNARFESYNRKNIRGSDLISLMNRVIDYNATESYFEGTNYERIRVTITLVKTGQNEDDILNEFKYDEEDGTERNKFLTKRITNTDKTNDWENDKDLIAITNTTQDACTKLRTLGVKNPSDAQLQQLSSKASDIILDENAEWAISYRFKRANVIEDLLGITVGTTSDCDIRINAENGKTISGKEKMDNIKNITSQYYQYTWFKRAMFDCTETIYDPETARVVEMNFLLQTKTDGDGKTKVVFN